MKKTFFSSMCLIKVQEKSETGGDDQKVDLTADKIGYAMQTPSEKI